MRDPALARLRFYTLSDSVKRKPAADFMVAYMALLRCNLLFNFAYCCHALSKENNAEAQAKMSLVIAQLNELNALFQDRKTHAPERFMALLITMLGSSTDAVNLPNTFLRIAPNSQYPALIPVALRRQFLEAVRTLNDLIPPITPKEELAKVTDGTLFDRLHSINSYKESLNLLIEELTKDPEIARTFTATDVASASASTAASGAGGAAAAAGGRASGAATDRDTAAAAAGGASGPAPGGLRR